MWFGYIFPPFPKKSKRYFLFRIQIRMWARCDPICFYSPLLFLDIIVVCELKQLGNGKSPLATMIKISLACSHGSRSSCARRRMIFYNPMNNTCTNTKFHASNVRACMCSISRAISACLCNHFYSRSTCHINNSLTLISSFQWVRISLCVYEQEHAPFEYSINGLHLYFALSLSHSHSLAANKTIKCWQFCTW